MVTFFEKLVEHIFYTTISVFLLNGINHILKYFISKYNCKLYNDDGEIKLHSTINFNGNDVKVGLINFIGKSYIFKVSIDKFETTNGIYPINYRNNIIHVDSSNVHIYDVIKILFNKGKEITLKEKTKSTIIRILTNNKILN